jgi:hypothetical protein
VNGLEDVVNAITDLATDGASHRLIVGQSSGKFLNCGVDDLEAVLEGGAVLELQLSKAGLKVGKRR